MSFWFVFPPSRCILPWLQLFVRLFGISVSSHSLRLAASPGDWRTVTVTKCQLPREAPEAQGRQHHGTEVMLSTPSIPMVWGRCAAMRGEGHRLR